MSRAKRPPAESITAQPALLATSPPTPASPSPPAPPPTGGRFTGKDGVTTEERERPFTDDPELLDFERAGRAAQPDQLSLFAPGPKGAFTPMLGGMRPLGPTSSLELARAWYRRELEQAGRPPNTIDSYGYDLLKLQDNVGAKAINRISQSDIADFLSAANNRSTRKRRLTSLRRFFRYLIDDARVLDRDPSDGFYPHPIQLRSVVPLFPEEQDALLAAAAEDEAWTLPACWLMLRLGLARGELLALRRDHIDLADPAQPVVFVFYEESAKRGKERKLAGNPEFASIYAAYLADREPVDLLFPLGFQAINLMVHRVATAAGLTKDVTPQVLRHTFAVERARDGADEATLLTLLGLADDPRNRASVGRYLKLAEPPL